MRAASELQLPILSGFESKWLLGGFFNTSTRQTKPIDA